MSRDYIRGKTRTQKIAGAAIVVILLVVLAGWVGVLTSNSIPWPVDLLCTAALISLGWFILRLERLFDEREHTEGTRARLRRLARLRVMDEAAIQHFSIDMQQVMISIDATIDIAVEMGVFGIDEGTDG